MDLYRVFDRQTRSITTDRKSYGGQVFDSNSTRIHFSLKDRGDDWDFEAEGYVPYIVFNVYDNNGNPYVYGPSASPAFDGHIFSIPYEITSQARSLRVEYILWFIKAEVADGFDGTPEGLLTTEYLCSAVDGIAFRASCIKPAKPGCGCKDIPFAPVTAPGLIGPLEALRSMAIVRPIEKVTHVNQFGEEQGLDFYFKSLSGEFQQMWLNVPTLSDEGQLKQAQLPFGNGYGKIPMLASSIGRNQALVFSPENGGFIGKKLGASLKYIEREEGTDKRHLVQMLDPNGEVIGEVDLPIEELVSDTRWDDENKELVLVFGTGREARIPMKDLVDVYAGVAGEIAISKVSSSSNGATETRYSIGIDSAYTASIAQRFAQASSATDGVQNALDAHKADLQNPHKVTKAQVGLGNADNTSDIDKPVSTAQKAYIDAVRTTADAYHAELAEYDKAQDARMDGIRSDLTALTEREDKRHQDVSLSLDARYTKADTDRLLQGKMDLVKWGDNISMTADRTVNVDLSGVKVVADDALNTASRNPIQNQAVAKALGNKQDKLVQGDNIVMRTNADGTVRISSTVSPMTVDNALDYTSENPVQNKVIYRALDQKANIGEGVGTWKGQTQGGSYLYQRGDVVVYEDALYISKVDNNDHHPDDESCWAVVRGGAVTQVVGITPATYIGLIGNDTDTEYEVKHRLGSRNLVFSFMTNDSNHEFIQARAWAPTMDTMRIRFTSPPGTNRIVVNIIKARSVNPSASQDFPLVVGVDTPAKMWSYTNETGCPLYAKAYDETGNDMEGDIIQNSPTDFDPVTITFAKEQKGSLVLASTTADNVYEVELDGENPYVITGLTSDKGYLIQTFADGTGQSRLDVTQEDGKVTVFAAKPWKGFVALYPATGMKKFTAADFKSVTHDGVPAYELTYQHNKGRAVGGQAFSSGKFVISDMHAEPNTVKLYASKAFEGALYII